MSQKRIKIADKVDGSQYWAPLMPIVEFCLERGCKLDGRTVERAFQGSREGKYICWIYGPVTMNDILEHFELPDHFETTDKLIKYEKFRTYFVLRTFKDLEEKVKNREEDKKKREEERFKIKLRRQELERLKSKSEDTN